MLKIHRYKIQNKYWGYQVMTKGSRSCSAVTVNHAFSGLSWSQLLDHATRELFLSRTVGLLDVVTCLEKTHDKQ